MKIRLLFIASLILCISFSSVSFFYANADDEEETSEEDQQKINELEGQIDKYTKKINELQNRASTLSGEMEYLDSQISLTNLRIQSSQAKIENTKKQIEKLGEEIEDLSKRIDKLEDSIDYQRVLLNNRFRERYKNKDISSIMVLFGSLTLDNLVRKTEYIKQIEKQDIKLLDEMDKAKRSYNTQKDIFEDRKKEEEELKAKLEEEKATLDAYNSQLSDQKEEKESLLASTQNDEAKYQDLLSEAQEQLASFKGFVNYAGGDVIGANGFGRGDKGWYYSQRDSRWAYARIGKSSENVFNVGCLITSIAMVYKSQGKDMDPGDIAGDSSRFWYNTAMMLLPWKGPGTYVSISKADIGNEVKKRPVIVGVYAGAYGTHFVVLAEKDGSDYVMYDPWYGPDLSFSDYYSFNSIFQAGAFR